MRARLAIVRAGLAHATGNISIPGNRSRSRSEAAREIAIVTHLSNGTRKKRERTIRDSVINDAS